jgi:hypothetical protein
MRWQVELKLDSLCCRELLFKITSKRYRKVAELILALVMSSSDTSTAGAQFSRYVVDVDHEYVCTK